MAQQATQSHLKQAEHTVKDWLLLHGLPPEKIKEFLLSANNYPLDQLGPFTDSLELLNSPVSYSAESIWQLTSAAFIHYLPSHARQIEEVINNTRTNFASSTAVPFTNRNSGTQEIEIGINYQHTCFDVLHVAHEFGHALQLSLTKSNFQPPILRELAALAAEKIFIKYLNNIRHKLAEATHWAWCANFVNYLNDDLKDLRIALDEVGTPYRYRWNYPVAFLLADTFIDNQPPANCWSLFEGTTPLEDHLQHAASTHLLRIDNYLPVIHSQHDEPNAIHAYRSLGLTSLLDIENWQGLAEHPIDKYYQTTCTHLQDGSLLALVNQYQQPIGYVTWNDRTKETLNIDHIAAPFGNHIDVLQKLRKTKPAFCHASTIHTNSATKEQIAWQE